MKQIYKCVVYCYSCTSYCGSSRTECNEKILQKGPALENSTPWLLSVFLLRHNDVIYLPIASCCCCCCCCCCRWCWFSFMQLPQEDALCGIFLSEPICHRCSCLLKTKALMYATNKPTIFIFTFICCYAFLGELSLCVICMLLPPIGGDRHIIKATRR